MDPQTGLPSGFSEEQIRFIIQSRRNQEEFETVAEHFNERWYNYRHLRVEGRGEPFLADELEAVFDWSVGDERYV